MPSIRRALIGYFLLLLGLALAAVGLVVDRLAREALSAREAAEVRRVDGEFEAHEADARRQFDDKLLDAAQALGLELRQKYAVLRTRDPAEVARQRLALCLLPAPGYGSEFSYPLALAVSTNGWVRINGFFQLVRRDVDDVVRQSFDDERHPDYFQFTYPFFGGTIRSNRQSFDLPVRTDELNRRPGFDHEFSIARTPDGRPLRVVVFKSPTFLRSFGPPPGGPRRGDRRDTSPPPPPPPPARGGATDPVPFVYVQVARPLSELDTAVAALAERRDAEKELLPSETEASLTRLRARLVAIGGVTFLALGLGGWLVVGRGLRPVKRLSDAVGRVSERDFRLPVEADQMSRELLPIHDRLTNTLTALRRAFDREKQAVADISHELRTPVAGLQATLDVALRKPRSADQYKTTLEECRTITRQLGRLVERVLTLARLDADTATMSVPTDLTDLTAGCVAVVRPLAEAHGLTVTADLHPGLSAVTDPDQVREVVMNLLSNAVEYNSPGGTVGVTARPSADGAAVIEVRDSGIGMAPDVAARIFERFYRADPSRHATGAHAGLGLAIVQEAVAKLGGTVAVESAPGRGSTFRVRLPAPELAG